MVGEAARAAPLTLHSGPIVAKLPKPHGETSGVLRRNAPSAPPIPPEVRALLGPPPITSFEDGDAYAQLEVSLAAAIQPRDAVEWIWLKDLVDLIWEARRLRRAKVVIVALRQKSARQVMSNAEWPDPSTLSNEELEALLIAPAVKVFARYGVEFPTGPVELIRTLIKNVDEAVERNLAEVGLDERAIESEAYRLCLPDLERLDRLITIADARRDTVLRDLYRRRDTLARQRGFPQEDHVIDAEFEE